MVKVQPIPEQLWGALGVVCNYLDFAQTVTGRWNPTLTDAIALVKEYQACHRADGGVSQRGEIPQAWNKETVFTPYREVRCKEKCSNQLLLPFGDEENV